jgi:hypothetical protein
MELDDFDPCGFRGFTTTTQHIDDRKKNTSDAEPGLEVWKAMNKQFSP